jgi:hypothetical protein
MFSRRTRLAALAGAAALAAAIALPASPAEAQSDCAFSTAGTPCYLQNLAELYAAGDTHGDTVNADEQNGTRYVFEPFEVSGGETYGYIENTNGALCWNTDYPTDNEIGLDSCQSADANELYAMVPCPNGSWCINNLNWGGNYKLWVESNGDPLELATGKGINDYDTWHALSST